MQEILDECVKNTATNGLKPDGVPLKALIVDDAVFIRRSIRKILTAVGYEVIDEAENGQEAIDKYVALKPDIVTMDITMPIMEGLDALKIIKEKVPGAKVVMISAMGYQKIVKECIIAGAGNFVVKPITAENLLKTLQIIKGVAMK